MSNRSMPSVALWLAWLPLLALSASCPAKDQPVLLWGDTHVHSAYSADAYLNGNFSADPETAYRYALGEPVIHPYHGARVQIDRPLDFLVVSDHAEFLGGIRTIHQLGINTQGMGLLDRLTVWFSERLFNYALRDGYGMDVFASMSATAMNPRERAAQLYAGKAMSIPGQGQIVSTAWNELANTADRFNTPGRFSALIGWEWTSTPGGANLHRVVFTNGDAASAATYIPFSRDDSPYPEDLWRWLAQTREVAGADFVAIPHNSNISKGYMFPETTLRGAAFTREYLRLRSTWEPVAEITQIKGDSETWPALSPDDPFADFEAYPFYIQAEPTPYEAHAGDFLRSALLRGLAIEHTQGDNPYRLGLIGSSDSHTGLAGAEEARFHGKLSWDSIPRNKRRNADGDGSATGWDLSASGLAAVWAKENTREAILDAFQRRAVYATTGPRITLQVAAHWSGDPANTVGMGAVLPARVDSSAGVQLRISAFKDPLGADLDRIQVVKGWIDASGATHEKIFDVAWSQPRALDEAGRPLAVTDTVNSETGEFENRFGAASLASVWQDPEFMPGLAAFYYVRVLEIPTPRHSLLDAVALGEPARNWPASLQERAYTSPVWYVPDKPGETQARTSSHRAPGASASTNETRN